MDMGPYYLTALVNLLGPIKRVVGSGKAFRSFRTIGSGKRAGETVPVRTPTHLSGIAEFVNGALLTITMSFDVWKHGHNHLELYGSLGSMNIPDPNRFDQQVAWSKGQEGWNYGENEFLYGDDNYRSIGLADLAHSIRTERKQRAHGEMALHVLEVMYGFLKTMETGQPVQIESRCERPAAMLKELPFGQLD